MRFPVPCNDAILLFDERNSFMSSVTEQLHFNGFKRVSGFCDSTGASSFMADSPVAVVVLWLYPPTATGKDLLREIIHNYPCAKVIVVSAINDHDAVDECMDMGASGYLIQPFDIKLLIKNIRYCLEKFPAQERNSAVQTRPNREFTGIPEALTSIVTRDRKLLTIFRYMEAIAPTSQAVMITGETGTGKELVARALHKISGRAGDLITVNVAGLDDIMFSDTLFGHGRGAFTGADRERKGLVEMAVGGTLFLDEIGDLNNASQVKLLRLLQEREYYPLGSDTFKISNARIIVATNSNLEERIKGGGFRSDLYYRLCSHHIHLPALRERSNDIPVLVEHFSKQVAKELGRQTPITSADTLDMLAQYDFPGNVRELKGLISNAVAVSTSGTLIIPKFKLHSTISPPKVQALADCGSLLRLTGRMPTLKEAEDYLIGEALRASNGNQRAAAVMLGISRQALNKRLQRGSHYPEKQSCPL